MGTVVKSGVIRRGHESHQWNVDDPASMQRAEQMISTAFQEGCSVLGAPSEGVQLTRLNPNDPIPAVVEALPQFQGG